MLSEQHMRMAGAIADSVARTDRLWFAAHPDATLMVRPRVPHEYCPMGEPCQPEHPEDATLVTDHSTHRTRQPVTMRDPVTAPVEAQYHDLPDGARAIVVLLAVLEGGVPRETE